LQTKDVTISVVKRRQGSLDQGYHGVAHFNVQVKPIYIATTHVSIVEADNEKKACSNNLRELVSSRPVGDASIMRLPSKRPRSFKIAVYESLQSKRPTIEDPAASDPFYFHKDVFDDDEVIELPLKR